MSQEIKQEANISTCKICQERKIKIFSGRYPSGNKKYQDENGSLWSGNICAKCNTSRLKQAMRKSREKFAHLK